MIMRSLQMVSRYLWCLRTANGRPYKLVNVIYGVGCRGRQPLQSKPASDLRSGHELLSMAATRLLSLIRAAPKLFISSILS